jgi:hypothetical protein
MIKVRFNLGRGGYYRHWQVTKFPNVDYFDPSKYSLILSGCRLKNVRNVADKIFNGQNKDVCSWVICDEVIATQEFPEVNLENEIAYNPKINPFWTDSLGNNIDGSRYKKIVSVGKRLYHI